MAVHFLLVSLLVISSAFVRQKTAIVERSPGQSQSVVDSKTSSTADRASDHNSIDHIVPFTVQAPSAKWEDERFQDGCEEASALMAVAWARGESLTPSRAESELLAAAATQISTYGSARDTSAQDTVERIIKGYFHYDNSRVLTVNSVQDITDELSNGRILIAPMDGQALANPYYSGDGPERHMVVIRGYDAESDMLITNDPGTKRGEAYRYPAAHFLASMRDYPTGDHGPIAGVVKKAIAVWRE